MLITFIYHLSRVAGIMLPHTLEERPHVSDSAVDFTRSVPSLITASDVFIKIHGRVRVFYKNSCLVLIAFCFTHIVLVYNLPNNIFS